MNKKIFIVITILLCMIAAGIGTMAVVSQTWDKKIQESKHWRNENGWLLKNMEQQQNADIEDLTVYDFSTFFMQCTRWSVLLESGSEINSLELMNQIYPVEFLQKIDEETVCVVYRFSFQYTNDDPTYAFVFFKKHLVSGNLEEWRRTGEVYFVNRVLSSDDFRNITEGTSAQELIALDAGVSYDFSYGGRELIRDDETSGITGISLKTWRVLSDGILIITAEMPYTEGCEINDYSEYTVTKVEWFPYGSGETPEMITLRDAGILSCFQ